jgi:hypothetical protein
MIEITVEGGAGTAQGQWRSEASGQVVLALDRAYAPGAPLTIRACLEGAQVALLAKTIGSKKEGEGFAVRAKLLSVTREDRDRIARCFGAP